MQKKIVMSAEQFAHGIERLAALRLGCLFLPFRICASSFAPPEEFEVVLVEKPLDEPIEKSETRHEGDGNVRLTFTKTELAHALTMEINVYQHGVPYGGNQIREIPSFIPDKADVEFEYVPQGGFKSEFKPKFGGL